MVYYHVIPLTSTQELSTKSFDDLSPPKTASLANLPQQVYNPNREKLKSILK
jgi:hypothetical protein